jgi:hypothetical protein
MSKARPKSRTLALLIAGAAALAVAATAFGSVAIYNNAFPNANSVKEMKQVEGGKPCSKSFRDKSKVMRVAVKRGDRLCAWSPPVQGDRALPDHEFIGVSRVLKEKTPKSVRGSAYMSLQVRFSPKESYELQITPKGKKWKFVRNPDGSGFPFSGKSKAINGLGSKNVLRVRAFGAKIAAYVNGKKLKVLTDNDPGQVEGRKVALGIGSRKNANKGPVGTWDNVRVLVPNP